MSNDVSPDSVDPARPPVRLTRRKWLSTFGWIVLGLLAISVLWRRYRRGQRIRARETLSRLGAGGGRRNADGSWLVNGSEKHRYDDPEIYDFLILRGKAVTDADLACLPVLTNIEWLDLSGTQITDDGLRHLKAMRQLRWLSLRGTQTTDAGRAALREALDKTKIVD